MALGGAAAASADTSVTAAPVTFIDTCGTDKDTFIIPDAKGVGYWVDGVKLDAGVHNVAKSNPYVQVFTLAEPGYTLSAPATWDHEFNATDGCASSAPAAPSASSTPSSASTPTSEPTIAPAPTQTGAGAPTSAGTEGTSNPTSSSSASSSASSLPRTGMDVGAPMTAASVALGAGVVLTAGAARRARR